VNLEVEAQQRLGHRRALDMPAGAAAAPRRVPGGVLAWLVRLPEGEIERVALELGAFHPLPLIHLVDSPMR